MALSFDNDNGMLSMWVDGELEQTQRATCGTGYSVPQDAYVNKR